VTVKRPRCPPPPWKAQYSHSPSWPLALPSWRASEVTATNTEILWTPPELASPSSAKRRKTQDINTQAAPEAVTAPPENHHLTLRRADVVPHLRSTPRVKLAGDRCQAGRRKGGRQDASGFWTGRGGTQAPEGAVPLLPGSRVKRGRGLEVDGAQVCSGTGWGSG
jgi:hypothetical protein